MLFKLVQQLKSVVMVLLNILKKALIPILIIAAAVIAYWWLISTKPETATTEQAEKRWLVDVVTAEFQSIAPEVTLYGRVETPRDAVLKSALVADVMAVYVLEGSEVKQGEVLIQLDDADVQLLIKQRQSAVASVKAKIKSEQQRYQRDRGLLENQKKLLELAGNAVERATTLQQNKLSSQANLDDALATQEQRRLNLKQLQYDLDEHPIRLAQLEAELLSAEASLQQAELDLSRTRIVAPFNGRVASLHVAVGDRVRMGDNLISVYDLDQLEVRAQIPGRYVGEVQKLLQSGYRLDATSDLYDDAFTLSLNRLSGEVNAESGGVDGLFKLDDSAMKLPLGTFMTLHLQLETREDVLSVPFAALYGLNHVYKIEAGHMKSVPVTRIGEIKQNGENWMLIRSKALKAGDHIIITQLPNAMTGLPVEAVSEQ